MTTEMTDTAMLARLLEELDLEFRKRKPEELTEQEYEEIAARFAARLLRQAENLVLTFNQEMFTAPAFKQSHRHTLTYKAKSAQVAEVIFSSTYPDEELALKVSLYRRRGPNPPAVALSLDISGEGVEAFRNFYLRYWRELEKLLAKSNLRLEAETQPEGLKEYKGKQVCRQVGLYMSEKEVEEGSFKLRAEFDRRRMDQRFESTFLVLAFIYESTCLSSQVLKRMNEVEARLRSTVIPAARQPRALAPDSERRV
ncbi:MAG TPA: hypothetical protein VE262_21845 [Blastocatellia bacterium]|nr:hypothetical protein [Blastocatellia bacterium]